MAYGSQSRTVQESVAPYFKALVPGADVEAKPCRGCMLAAASNQSANVDVLVTFADGSTATVNFAGGTIYPFAAIKTDNAGVIFFY